MEAISIEDLDSELSWDYSSYDDLTEMLHHWTCPGCSFSSTGDNWQNERRKHRRKCKYYDLTPAKRYEHETSKCICCIVPYHESKPFTKIKATKVKIFYSVLIP